MPIEEINGTTLHYRVSGAGTPLILIHPPLLSSANFQYQLEQLSDVFQVIAFDIRGHGLSAGSRTPITYRLIAEDMKLLLDRLKIDKAFVCGYSTGGSVALEAMLSYPDRFYGAVLISAMSEASDLVLRNRIRIAIGLSRWKLATRLLRLGIAWGNSDNRQTFRNLINHSKQGNNLNIHQYYRCSLNYSCTARLSAIKLPVLLLYGEKDWGFKRYCRKLMDGLPYSSLVMLPKEKHQLPTKAAEKIGLAIKEWVQLTGRLEASREENIGDQRLNQVTLPYGMEHEAGETELQ